MEQLVLLAQGECHLLGHHDVMLMMMLTCAHQEHVDEHLCYVVQHSGLVLAR